VSKADDDRPAPVEFRHAELVIAEEREADQADWQASVRSCSFENLDNVRTPAVLGAKARRHPFGQARARHAASLSAARARQCMRRRRLYASRASGLSTS
jgi:hypothetical protein